VLMIATRNVDVERDGEETELPKDLPAGQFVALEVRDDGAGMDADTLKRVFEPFFTTKGVDEGTGLGLSTVYGIVKQSGGHITVESEPGVGTRFQVFLPRVEGGPPTRSARPASMRKTRGHETLLVVEDEDLVRHATARILKSRGYTVLEAESADAALVLAEHYDGKIDVLVTDVVLPGKNGVELAQALEQSREGLRVLYVSGYAGTPRVSELLPADAPVLAKPFASGALLRMLDAVLGRGEEPPGANARD